MSCYITQESWRSWHHITVCLSHDLSSSLGHRIWIIKRKDGLNHTWQRSISIPWLYMSQRHISVLCLVLRHLRISWTSVCQSYLQQPWIFYYMMNLSLYSHLPSGEHFSSAFYTWCFCEQMFMHRVSRYENEPWVWASDLLYSVLQN